MKLRRTLFCLFALPLVLSAKTSVWKVSSGDNSVYLGGTCHILRPQDFPLPEAYEQAYEAADSLTFEVDPAKLQSPEFSMQLMAASRYQDGRTLKDVLNTEAYSALSKHAGENGIPMVVLDSIKPGMVVTMLTIQELMKLGVTQEGVDLFYAKKSAEAQKPIGSLETAEFQIQLLTSLGEGLEDEMVLYSLQDLDQIESLYQEMIRAWREGDLEGLEKLFVTDMQEYPSIYDALLKDRNLNWLGQIKTMLSDADTEYVLVGVAHMVGPDGLIHLLEDAGYRVEQL